MAKKLKFHKEKAGGADKVREDISRGSGFGNMLWIKDGDSKTIRILDEPKDWIKYTKARFKPLQAKGNLPTYSGWDADYPDVADHDDTYTTTAHVIRVAVVDDKGKLDRMMFWEPPKKIVKDLLAHFDRRKTVCDRDWEIVREGKMLDTTYTIIPDDPNPRKDKEFAKLKELDFDDELVRMVEEFAAAYEKYEKGDDDEEDEKPKKKGKSSTSKKRRAVVEDDDEEEEEEAESEDDDDEESSEEEEADDEGEDDEEEEIDLDEMDIDELKALAKKLGVDVKKGSKSPSYRKAIAAHLESASSEEDDEEEEEEGEEEEEAEGGSSEETLEGTFVIEDIDVKAYTATFVDAEGEAREVYLDSQQHELEDFEDGKKVEATIALDEDQDWIVESDLVPVKAKKASGKKSGKKSKK